MFKSRKSIAVVGGAAVIIALTGCAGAGASGSAPGAVELHQERALPHSAAGSSAARMQGQRLAEYAEARAATAENSAARMQGQRLAEYAEARAVAGTR